MYITSFYVVLFKMYDKYFQYTIKYTVKIYFNNKMVKLCFWKTGSGKLFLETIICFWKFESLVTENVP